MSSTPAAREDQAKYDAFIQAANGMGFALVSDEPMARHCTFRIGGPADLYAVAEDVGTLARLGSLATDHGIPVTVLGGGSNILISDLGIRGLVIANQTREIEIGDPSAFTGRWATQAEEGEDGPESSISGAWPVVVDSGVALAGLARSAIRAGWSGLEWAVSVPGTVGGAIVGNAGAHGGQIADCLAWALLAHIQPTGHPGAARRMVMADQLAFSYRDSTLKRQWASGQLPTVVLRAGFHLVPGNLADMTVRADSFLAKRRASQPVEPSAGSVFRNPPGDHAGRLVELAGMKGLRIGGAQVSPRHANYIINTGHARAVEVAELIGLVQRRVREGTGVGLEPEILFVGEWSDPR